MTDIQYIIDHKGKKIGVQLPLDVYDKLVADAEELYEIKEYKKAKSSKSDPIPFDQAFREIEDDQ